MKNNIQAILMILAFYFFGSLSIYDGIKDFNNKEYDGYTKVIGTFLKPSVASNGEDINLVYQYKVNNITYTIASDYSSDILPEVGSSKTIYYNPMNPSIAVLDNTKTNVVSIVVGVIFIIFPTVAIIFVMLALNKIYMNNVFMNSLVVGLIFIFLGSFTYYAMSIGSDSFSLSSVYKANKLWILVPFLFIFSGLYTLVSGIIYKIKKMI